MKRIIIVYNPNSSQYVHVKDEVLSHLTEIKSHIIGKFAIKKAPFEENLKLLKGILKDGDTVIAAGGDATASVSFNAILESGKDVTLGVLPYGNFNDLARTLGTKKLSDIVVENDLPREAIPTTFYPLDILVNGKHWRYAACYVTIGMTAEAVELFDDPKIRKKMKEGHRSSWRSYVHLATWYFKHRHKKVFIPEFKLNNQPMNPKISDYAAVNGKSMSRVMKGGDDYKKPKIFRSETEKTTSFPKLFMLMAKSILHRVPGKETKRDVLEFLEPATIELQAEGEYKVFENVKTIEIKKPEKPLKVIHK